MRQYGRYRYQAWRPAPTHCSGWRGAGEVALELFPYHVPVDLAKQRLLVDGLGDIAVHPVGQIVLLRFGHGIGGQGDDGNVGPGLL